MGKRGKAHRQFGTPLFGLIQNQHCVKASINFRMPFGRLGNTKECLKFRKQALQCYAIAVAVVLTLASVGQPAGASAEAPHGVWRVPT